MKSLIAILLGSTLALSLFAIHPMTMNLHSSAQSMNLHASTTTDCDTGSCPEKTTDCVTRCFMKANLLLDNGMLPLSSSFFFLLFVALLTFFFADHLTPLSFVSQPLAYRDPRLILTTHKRE